MKSTLGRRYTNMIIPEFFFQALQQEKTGIDHPSPFPFPNFYRPLGKCVREGEKIRKNNPRAERTPPVGCFSGNL